jgi:hypothetical protein
MRWLVIAALVAGCGSNHGSGGTDAPGTGNVDARFPTNCTAAIPGAPQCSNCIDDDGDGNIDGYDLQCTGPMDNDESSFATGIPGDNIDPVKQDCFFDGNSGSGNDGCDIHVCCLLGATTVAACPIGANRYNPADCPPPIGTRPLTQMCIDYCGKLTPPGCDCFGCCTLCDPAHPGTCYDIATNITTSPNCTQATLGDPTKCLRCTQVPSCGPSDCGGTTCILCPGQDPSTLPASCNMTPVCPGTEQSCQTAACPANTYCANGCCVGIVQ